MTTPQEMLRWLETEGNLNHSEVARRTKSTQATIWRIANGKQSPKYGLGIEIQNLYEQVKANRVA